MAVAEPSALTEPRYYVWCFPGSPVKVHLALDVVQRLKERLKPAIQDEGVLLGRALDGATEILDFQPASGRTISDLLALRKGQPQRNLVGYYRTETGDSLHLTEADRSVDTAFFGGPNQVFLLIQQVPFGVPNAGFFFHDEAGEISPISFMEFPFDPTLLASEERGRIRRSLRATDDQPAPGLVSAPEAAPVSRRRHHKTVLAVSVLAAVAILSVGIWLRTPAVRQWVQRTTRPVPPHPTQGPVTPVYPSMGLHANRQGGDVALTWNHESPLITGATSGSISIEDGDVRNEVLLDSAALKGGSLVYSPLTERIIMRLAITNPVNTVIESVTLVIPQSVGGLHSTVSASKTSPVADATLEVVAKTPPATVPTKKFIAPVSNTNPPVPSLNEPPVVHTSSGVTPGILPFSTVQIPPPAPPGAPLPASPAPQRQEVVPYQPPVAIRKVMPRFPMPRSSLLQPKYVKVRVMIDKTGSVTKVEPIPEPKVSAYFSAEAVAAARLWKFQPARLNNQPIDGELVLQFVFRN